MTRERDAVLERIRDQAPPTREAFERLIARRDARQRAARVRATIVGTGVAAVVVAGALAAWWTTSVSDGVDRQEGPAAETLDVRLVAADGEYYYQRTVRYSGAVGAAVGAGEAPSSEEVIELWIGADRSGHVLRKPPDLERVIEQRYDTGEMPEEWYVDLPDDPDALMDALIARSASDGASPVAIATTSPGRDREMTAVLRAMQDLLTFGSGILTPSQQAALLRSAGNVTDVMTEPDAIDPLGRAATKLSFVIHYNQGEGSTVEWYVEPSTDQLLAELWVDRASGRVTSAFLVEAAGIAPSLEEPPAPRDLYVPEGTAEPSFP